MARALLGGAIALASSAAVLARTCNLHDSYQTLVPLPVDSQHHAQSRKASCSHFHVSRSSSPFQVSKLRMPHCQTSHSFELFHPRHHGMQSPPGMGRQWAPPGGRATMCVATGPLSRLTSSSPISAPSTRSCSRATTWTGSRPTLTSTWTYVRKLPNRVCAVRVRLRCWEQKEQEVTSWRATIAHMACCRDWIACLVSSRL